MYNQTFMNYYHFRGRKPSSISGNGRWVITDVGDKDGPLDDTLLMYRSDKSGDYHGEFNGEKYNNIYYKVIVQLFVLSHVSFCLK